MASQKMALHFLTLFASIICALTGAEGAFIQVERHTLPDRLDSLNGSDENGGCPTECVYEINGIDVCECTRQTNSTLIDGVCPTSIDTTQSNWASELFTIDRNGETTVSIGFELTSRINLRGVELKLFNCVSEGTVISTVNVYPSIGFPVYGPLVDPSPIGSYVVTGDDLSCNSVTTLVIPTTPLSFTLDTVFIEFEFPQGDSNTGIYIAEIGFSDTTITAPTEMPTTPAQPSSSQAPSPSSTPSAGPSPSTTLLSTTTETSSSQEVSTITLLSTSSTSTQTVLSTSPTPLPPSTDPSTTLSTDPPAAATPLGIIVGSLVGVIVVLLIVILAGVIVVVFFMTRNRRLTHSHPQEYETPVTVNGIELQGNEAYGGVTAISYHQTDQENTRSTNSRSIELIENEAYGGTIVLADQQEDHEYEYVSVSSSLHSGGQKSREEATNKEGNCRHSSKDVVYEELQ